MENNLEMPKIASSGNSTSLLSLDKLDRGNNSHEDLFFDKAQEWLTALEAAIYLRKFRPNRSPSKNAIYMMVYRGALKRRKFNGRLYFKRYELQRAIDRGDSL
ncbi:MAG: hypothetical protein WCK43_06945 [bacterium]